MKLKQLLESHYGSLIDKEVYDDMDSADRDLYRYTADGYVPPFGKAFETLEERYPFDGGVLYRGLLFPTVEKYEAFISNIKDGKIVMEGSSSWTPSIGTAVDFARTEKTYFPTREIMAAHSATQKAGDHMSGEGGGVVLKTTTAAGIGIDVNKTKFAKESEVILPSGTYEVEIHKTIRPFRVTHKNAEKANEMADEVVKFVKTGKGDKKEILKYVTYLTNSWLDELTPPQVDALIIADRGEFDLENLRNNLKDHSLLRYSYEEGAYFHGANIEGGIHIPVSRKMFDAASPALRKKITTFLKMQLDHLGKDAQRFADDLSRRLKEDDFGIHRIDIQGMHELGQLIPSLQKQADLALLPLKKFFSSAYQYLNSREYNKTITKDKMSKHAELMGKIIGAMRML